MAITVVVLERAALAIEHARAQFPRIDEIMVGWTWRLVHDPHQGYAIPGTNPQCYICKSGAFKQFGVPAVRIAYRLVGEVIRIESIHIE